MINQPLARDGAASRREELVRRLAIDGLRVLGVVVFGNVLLLLARGAITGPGPTSTPQGTIGPYPISLVIGAVGLVVGVLLWLRLSRADSLAATLGWLLGGTLVMAGFLLALALSDPACSSGECTDHNRLIVITQAVAPRDAGMTSAPSEGRSP